MDGLKVDGRWQITKDSVLLRLYGSAEEEALCDIERADKEAITAARKSGKAQIKQRK